MDNSIQYRNAERYVEMKLGFFIHLAAYATVNTGLITLNLMQESRPLWAIWPLFGWGIGLIFHGIGVFLRNPLAAWKRRMIEYELKKQTGTRTE